jgi:hypothetical protein
MAVVEYLHQSRTQLIPTHTKWDSIVPKRYVLFNQDPRLSFYLLLYTKFPNQMQVPLDQHLSMKSIIENTTDKRTCYSNSISSFPAGDWNTALISSNETFAVSGTRYVGRRYTRKHAVENVWTVALVQRFVVSVVDQRKEKT